MKSTLLRRTSKTRLLSRNKSRSKLRKLRSNSRSNSRVRRLQGGVNNAELVKIEGGVNNAELVRLQGGVNNAELVKIVRAEFPQYEFAESKDGKNHIKLTSNEGWSISLGSQHRGDKFGSDVHLALIRNDVRRFHESHLEQQKLEERRSSSPSLSESSGEGGGGGGGGGDSGGGSLPAKQAAAYARYLLKQAQSPQNPVVGFLPPVQTSNENEGISPKTAEELRLQRERREALKVRQEAERIARAAIKSAKSARVKQALEEARAAKVSRQVEQPATSLQSQSRQVDQAAKFDLQSAASGPPGIILSLLIGIVYALQDLQDARKESVENANKTLTNSTVNATSLKPFATLIPSPVTVPEPETVQNFVPAQDNLSLDSKLQYIIDTNKLLYDFFVKENFGSKVLEEIKINEKYILKLSTANFNSLLRFYNASNALVRKIQIYLKLNDPDSVAAIANVYRDYVDSKNIVISEIYNRNLFFKMPRKKVETSFSTSNKFHASPKRRSKVFNSGR